MIPCFEDALQTVYCERPCELLPNALWKTLRMVSATDVSKAYSGDLERGIVDYVHAYDDERLLVYWERGGKSPEIDEERIERLRLVLLHEQYVSGFPVDSFPVVTRSFRLIHRGHVGEVRLPDGFGFREVDVVRQAEAIAGFIDRCYVDITPTAETVRGWMNHPVYAPDLWVWVADRQAGVWAGLGIAEVDESVPEASLEWIQVSPAYRRRGIGLALVRELLRRVAGRVDFTTVAGRVDNVTSPEGLYRQSGFEGQDVWWVMRKSGR